MVTEGVFVRKSSGLVREVGVLGALGFNLLNWTFGSNFWFLMASAAFVYPSGDLNAAIIITTILFAICAAVVFGFLSAIMPRAGAPYIFLSRILHPVLGFMVTVGQVFALILWTGMWAGMMGTWVLPVLFATAGAALRSPQLLVLAGTVATPVNAFLIGIICLVPMGVLAMIGMKNFLKVTLAIYAIGVVGVVVALVLLATSTPQTFITRFNNFSLFFKPDIQDYYHYVINVARDAGFVTPPITATGTLLVVLAPLTGTYYWVTHATSMIAGEIKEVKRSMLYAVWGGIIVATVFFIATVALTYRVVGREFFQASTYLYMTGKEYYLYPVPPYYTTFASLLTDNVLIQIIIAVGMAAWTFPWIAPGFVIMSRYFFAWSFDRLLPSFLAEVNPRLRAPVRAIILSIGLGLVFLFVYVLWPTFFQMVPAYTFEAIVCIFLGIAAIVLPFKMRKTFEASTVNYRVAGVPVLTIGGLILTALFSLRLVLFIFAPEWSPGLFRSPAPGWPPMVWLVVIILVGSFIYYWALRALRKRQAIDIDLAFKELPPE